MRALGAGEARNHSGKVEFHDVTRVVRFGLRSIVHAEKILFLEVCLNSGKLGRLSANQLEVFNRLLVNREVAHSGSILG